MTYLLTYFAGRTARINEGTKNKHNKPKPVSNSEDLVRS